MTYTSYQTMENQSSPSILLVEDDPALALIIKDTLEGEGFQVTHTADGLHGLDGFMRCRPDLVVADIMMPGMDGFEMVRRMRRVDTTTPILFLTALVIERSGQGVWPRRQRLSEEALQDARTHRAD